MTCQIALLLGISVAIGYMKPGSASLGSIVLWTAVLAFFGFVMGRERSFKMRSDMNRMR